jgi:hypothetical protein
MKGVQNKIKSIGNFFTSKKMGINLRTLAIGSAAVLGTTAFMGSKRSAERNKLNLADRRDRLRNR